MHIIKKTCGILAVAALGFNIAACSTADKGGGAVQPVPPTIAVDNNGNAQPLTLTPANVGIGETSNLTWSVAGASNCTASGDKSNGKWTGSQPTSGSVQVGPYNMVGEYSYVLTCTSDSGGSLSQIATLNVGSPAVTTGVALISNSSTAKPKETISLSWSTSGNPTSCTATSNPVVDGWSGRNVPTVSPNSGEWLTLPNAGSYTFTLTCTGPGGTASSSVPVTVADDAASAPPLLQISASPASITEGGSSLIRWTTANATSCKGDANETADSWKGSSQPVNDLNSTATATTFTTANTLTAGNYSYVLACSGPGGNVSQGAPLLVTANSNNGGNGNTNVVPALVFAVSNTMATTGSNSTTIKVGEVVYLSWESTNANSCVASGGSWAPSSQPTSFSNLVRGGFNSPGNYSFALTCSNASGNSVAQVVQVIVESKGPSVSFTAQPNSGTQGMPANLVWTSSDDATSCQAVSGPTADTSWTGTQPTSGSHAIPASVYNTPGTYTYVLSCTGPTGTTTSSTNFVVNPGSTGGPQFTSAFTANPTSLPAAGGSTSLTWATSNAVSCTASSNPAVSGWTGAQPTNSASGGVDVALPANSGSAPVSYTLELNCSNGSGSTTQSQVVTVQGMVPSPTVTLSANPLMVVAGADATTTLTYSSSNVTSCTTTGGNANGVWATQPTPNAGATSVTGMAESTPMTAAGTYTYTLSCTGPGGTASATPVTVVATSAAPSFTPVKNQSPTTAGLFVSNMQGSTTSATQVAPGGDLYFSWNASNATSCMSSSTEPGSSAWASATTGTSGMDKKVTASNVPGQYTYTITCSGPTDPSASSTVSVLVMSPTASFCPNTPTSLGLPIASMALLADSSGPSYAATTPSATGSSVCVGCTVGAAPNTTGNVSNAPVAPAPLNFPYGFTDYASMILPVGALTANAEEINVRDTSATPVVYPAGRTVNVGLEVPSGLVVASVLGVSSISTTLNGVVQDTTLPGLLTLQLLGLVGSGNSGYTTLTSTKPFDGVRVNFGGTVTAISELDVHMACVSLQ